MKLQVSTILFVATIGLAKAGTFLEDATDTGNYGTLIGAITNETLNAVLEVAPVTVFAPQDSAFADIEDVVAGLEADALQNIIAGHVVAVEYRAAEVIAAGCVELETLNPEMKLKVSVEGDVVMVNDATVVETDLGDEDTVGVLHGIDKVILPGTFTPCPSMAPSEEPSTSMEPTMMPSTSVAPSTSMAPSISMVPSVAAVDPTGAPVGSSASKISALIGSLASVLVGYMIA